MSEKSRLFSIVFVLGLALLFFGCTQPPNVKSGPAPSVAPTIPPLPSEAPAGECVTRFDLNSCCKGDSCLMVDVDCADMKTPVFKGCDASCTPIIDCVASASPAPSLIGGDRDAHGCIGSAGYSWCEAKQKCLRVWEENCSNECSSDNNCTVGGCSGELCGANGGELVSTCIYKPEFQCYKLAQCGCAAGQCAWKKNAAFDACLSNETQSPEVKKDSVIEVHFHASSDACPAGPTTEYVLFANGTGYGKGVFCHDPTEYYNASVSQADLVALAEKIMALDTPEMAAENASEATCFGAWGSMVLSLDGRKYEFHIPCGLPGQDARKITYRARFYEANDFLMSLFGFLKI